MSILLGSTVLNSILLETQSDPVLGSDHPLASHNASSHSLLVEYAGRVCYNSEGKMGHSPTFIKHRAGEGHTDIIEHSSFALTSTKVENIFKSGKSGKYFDLREYIGFVEVMANSRTWLEYYKAGKLHHDTSQLLEDSFPELFDISASCELAFAAYSYNPVGTVETDSATVSALAWTEYAMKPESVKNTGQITFLIDGLSRNACNQLVRHRSCSFSQASQRYIDQRKTNEMIVIPSHVKVKSELRERLIDLYEQSMYLYDDMRKARVPKEDARYALLSSMPTKIVVSIPYSAMGNFLALRTAKDAQWELRYIAEAIEELYKEVSEVYRDE